MQPWYMFCFRGNGSVFISMYKTSTLTRQILLYFQNLLKLDSSKQVIVEGTPTYNTYRRIATFTDEGNSRYGML